MHRDPAEWPPLFPRAVGLPNNPWTRSVTPWDGVRTRFVFLVRGVLHSCDKRLFRHLRFLGLPAESRLASAWRAFDQYRRLRLRKVQWRLRAIELVGGAPQLRGYSPWPPEAYPLDDDAAWLC